LFCPIFAEAGCLPGNVNKRKDGPSVNREFGIGMVGSIGQAKAETLTAITQPRVFSLVLSF
jgi:hypothetical protein